MKIEILPVEETGVIAGLQPGLSEEHRATLDDFLAKSERVLVCLMNDEFVCMWGLISQSIMSQKAYMWSWTSPTVKKYKKSFVKTSYKVIADALAIYPTLVGHCDGESKWLKMLGARFGQQHAGHTLFTIGAEVG